MGIVAMLVSGILGALRQPVWWPFVAGLLIGLFDLQVVNSGRTQLGLGPASGPEHVATFIVLSYIGYCIGGLAGQISRWASKAPADAGSSEASKSDTPPEGEQGDGPARQERISTSPVKSSTLPLASPTGVVSWIKGKSISSAAASECDLYREGRLPKFRKLMIDDLAEAWKVHCRFTAAVKGDDWPLDVVLQEFAEEQLGEHLSLATVGRIPLTPQEVWLALFATALVTNTHDRATLATAIQRLEDRRSWAKA